MSTASQIRSAHWGEIMSFQVVQSQRRNLGMLKCSITRKYYFNWNIVTEEIAFQLKTTALSGKGGHTGQERVAGECLQFHKHGRAIYTCTAAKRNGFPPPHHFPNFGTICEHAAEQIEELLQAEIYWRKGIFNLEQLPNAIHHAATQNTAASSRERETPRLDGQVYAR